MKNICFLLISLVILPFTIIAQAIKIPFTPDKWNTEDATVKQEQYMGKESIAISGGLIYARDIDFLDGVLEVDFSVPRERFFPGIAFRLQDKNNYENFYVRPHQSGNPDATQYTPVFNGLAGWQLYHGEGYSNAFNFKFDAWHHLKIDVHGNQAEIYIDDMNTPLIKVTELKRDWKAGKIGLSGGNAPVHFANLQYTPKKLAAPSPIMIPDNGKDGLITEYQVSNTVNLNDFEKAFPSMDAEFKKRFTRWSTQRSEPSGVLNLAKHGQPEENRNAMVAKVIIESESNQLKMLEFGFSDFALVFLNDTPLFLGKDNFMSRDYRFLGTIGYFDIVFLPLKKGRNELWIAVGETFGGWGLKARFADMKGIKLAGSR